MISSYQGELSQCLECSHRTRYMLHTSTVLYSNVDGREHTLTHCPTALVSANVENVGKGNVACLSHASIETPNGRQNNGTLSGSGNSE